MSIENFWQNLENASQAFFEPVLCSNTFAEQVSFTENDALILFRNLSLDSPRLVQSALRVFLNGGISYAAEDKLYETPPQKNEDFFQWLKSVLGTEKFGIILNKAERWNNQLLIKMINILQPILGKLPPENFSYELAVFIGNYGYTPFGVHLDDSNIRVIHFQVSGHKKMLLWDKSQFEALEKKNRDQFFDISKLPPPKHTYTIKPGNIFFLPSNYYHIGFTEELTLDIALVIRKEDQYSLFKKIAQYMIEDAVQELTPSQHENETTFCSSNSYNEDVILEKMKKIDFHPNLTSIYHEYMLKRRSNFGFLTNPLSMAPKSLPGIPKKIEQIGPFVSYYIISDNTITIIVRGYKAEFPLKSSIRVSMETLNSLGYVEALNIFNTITNEQEKMIFKTFVAYICKYGNYNLYY